MKRQLKTYCFSPPIMLATFLFEIGALLYIIYRYKTNTISRLVIGMLLFLAIFQGAEYMICGGFGLNGDMWSRLGYSSITLLPPIGLHLGLAIAGKNFKLLTGFSYLLGISLVLYFSFYTLSIAGNTCYPNYAVFDIDQGPINGYIYGVYYYGLLLLSVFFNIKYSIISSSQKIKKALFSLAIGYSAFIIPTTFFNLIDPDTIAGIPSIMCGFAVIYAFILVRNVAPNSLAKRKNK